MTRSRRAMCRAFAAIATFASQTSAQRSPVDTLAWMSGCWRMSSPTVAVDEQWMAPAGGVMLGMSRTVVRGTAREHEFLRIFASGDTLVYAASPSRQQPTEFRARTVSANEVVFENPSHDFPQRIRYRRDGPSALVATIEGDRSGKRQPVVFSYARTTCGAPAPTDSHR